jgi:hypothetical protein
MGIWYQEVLGDIPRCRTSGQDGLLANRSQKLLSSMTGCERFQRMEFPRSVRCMIAVAGSSA